MRKLLFSLLAIAMTVPAINAQETVKHISWEATYAAYMQMMNKANE